MRMTLNCGIRTMYVCLCNGFTNRCVDRAIDSGARTVGQVYQNVGCRPQCGTCRNTIREQIAARTSEAELAVTDAA
ncbi:(2Fe-2S)-binding protein [Nisaea sp.]|uniref:(2Fe-2S)-binding protein n=1 Tax=Nisaea sp. TaxID=2024842 RepID=UPI003B520579